MPSEGFLQRFHDLVDADTEVRCQAALAVRQDLQRCKGTQAEELEYTFRRLVRGIQSSRACARQGFSLALSEVLVAFPDELQTVLKEMHKLLELQVGLKNSELKDRLLGRLGCYSAILQSGCLTSSSGSSSSSQQRSPPQGALKEIGKGLHDLFNMRPYMKAPAARILVDVVAQLVDGQMPRAVPELLAPWALEEKASSMGSEPDVHAAGVIIELRAIYVQASSGSSQEGFKSWPACIRKDLLSSATASEALIKAVGTECAANPLSDGLTWIVAPFCTWILQVSKQTPAETIWSALHGILFPEGKSTPAAEAQGLRALAEIASQLREIGLSEASSKEQTMAASNLMAGLFEQMPRALSLLFKLLCWNRAQTHLAAVYTQQRLVEAVGTTLLNNQQNGKRKRAHSQEVKPPLPMTDKKRLSILSSIQSQKTFGVMNGKFQRMWQHALLTPLSSEGVRLRCNALLRDMSKDTEGTDVSNGRAYADQLVQLATHSHAPDEVILAALCLLMTESYFEPTAGSDNQATFSMNKFTEAASISIPKTTDDLILRTTKSACTAGGTTDEDKPQSGASHRTQWRLKLWQSLVGLSRRMSPDQAAKLAATGKENGGDDAEFVVKTFAFHGCLADGSLWVMRMHDWWDHICSPGDSQASGKKKRKVGGGGKMQCIVELEEEDLSLRKRCLKKCRAILKEPESEASLPSRQRNALCALPLVLALYLLDDDDDKETDEPSVREPLGELIKILEDIPETPALPDSGKQRAKALAAFQAQRAEVLRQVPLIAAELFVKSNRLVKEAARTAWRELGDFIPEETLKGLCGSVKDEDPEEEEEEDAKEEDDGSGTDPEDVEDENEAVSATTAAKIARLEKAKADLKAQREAEKPEKAGDDGDNDEDDDDEIMLDGEGVLTHLLDDADESNNLLSAFAGGGLEGNDDSNGPKTSKWMLRLKQRQDDLTRKFREVELLEMFSQRCAEKQPIAVHVLQELFEALLLSGRRAMGKDTKDDAEDGTKQPKKRTKANAMLQKMEKELTQRLASVLQKVLRNLCRPPTVAAISKWHTASEWAERARALASRGSSPSTSAAGQRPSEVGAVLLYWLCSLHRARSAADASTEPGKWTLAEELLETALKDWGSKKNSDKWSEAALNAFAVRVPQAMLTLPWGAQIRGSRNLFIQREQVGFVTNSILRSLAPETEGAPEFSAEFASLCAELLENTLKGAEDGEQAASASQKQKMRREVMRCLAVLLRSKHKKGSRQHSVPDAICKRLAKTVAKVRDALPGRHGEVFQLCLHLLRTLNPKRDKSPVGDRERRDKSPGNRSPVMSPNSTPPSSPKLSAKKAKLNGGQPSKGSKGFFGAM